MRTLSFGPIYELWTLFIGPDVARLLRPKADANLLNVQVIGQHHCLLALRSAHWLPNEQLLRRNGRRAHQFHPMVVQGVHHCDEASGLRPGLEGEPGDVPDEDRVEVTAYLQVVGGTEGSRAQVPEGEHGQRASAVGDPQCPAQELQIPWFGC